ncbi:N-acetylmannosamine-6-phosphate 2-epimerase [Luteococcus sp. OSA5]|uniref:N-acetylmannosamine-6-phosphate 2-epimerase n=1 Tax=Luteococcus sp. OSA5 TaxID=3401630 RepID=UPI003B4324B2
MNDVIEQLRGRLIVSCQAYPGEPMLDPRTMAQIAESVASAGAAGIRAKGLDDLRLIRERVQVPIIGIVKVGHEGVFITPTLDDCLQVADTGCEIVALDGTRRPRPDGRTLEETIAGLKQRFPEVLVMADCGSLDDAHAARLAGADILATTLAGYSGERPKTSGPDWEIVNQFTSTFDEPVVVEGRIHSPADAAEAIGRGATSVVVGTAITHPASITKWFIEAIDAR